MALNIVITDAGRQEIINAENNGTTPVTISEIALGTGQYAPSKTQTALNAEFKRLATISGEIVAADTIHVVLKDESNDGYSVGEFGLFTASGTLFAVYSQEPASGYIAEKNAASTLLLAVDVVLSTLDAASLNFGDVSFTNPPASETVKGVVELADGTEALAGADLTHAMSPRRVHEALNKYGLGKSAPIPGSTDIRTYIDARIHPAFYHSGFGANSGLSGLPSDLRGALLSLASDDVLKSMLFIGREDENAWLNIADSSGAWRAWRKIHHSGNFDPALKANLTGNTFTAAQTIANGAGYGSWGVNRNDQSAAGNVDKALVDVETGTGAARLVGLTNSSVHGQLKMTPDQKLTYNDFLVWHEGNSPAQPQANGYQKLPSGLIIQWGSISGLNYTANGNQNFPITFPIAFPNACRLGVAVATLGNQAGGNSSYTTEAITQTGLRLTYSATVNYTGLSFNWFAIGY